MAEPDLCLHAIETIPFLRAPRTSDLIFKDECTLCFENQECPEGIDVCLTCFNGSCRTRKHSQLHCQKTLHPLVLNIRTIIHKKENSGEPLAKITKLAFGVPGGATTEGDFEAETLTSVRCVHCDKEIERSVGQLPEIIDAIVLAQSALKKEEIANWQWELKVDECEHARSIVQQDATLAPRALAHCGDCELSMNLWLCLTCGYLGCGRKQGDKGGNGHALSHYKTTGHGFVCKLGTITADGKADCYCYACDDEKSDSHLAQHLSHFGIDVKKQEKTEMTMAEMELEMNKNFTVNSNVDDGNICVPLYGKGYTGLENLGNSCYMASVLQVLFHDNRFADRYNTWGAIHQQTCTLPPANCYHCQMAKVAIGLASGEYSQAPEPAAPAHVMALDASAEKKEKEDINQKGVPPRMLKNLIARGHPLFSTNQQQDAMEFLQHITRIIQQNEHVHGPDADPSRIFNFKIEQKMMCTSCMGVRYSVTPAESIGLFIPMDQAVPNPPNKDGTPTPPTVPFDACLRSFYGEEIVDFKCPGCHESTKAVKYQRFRTFPDTLVVQMHRIGEGVNYVPVKLDVDVAVPEHLDLASLHGTGLQPGENELPEDKVVAAPKFVYNDELLSQLTGLGFSTAAAKKALKACNNSNADAAAEWLFAHMEDPDLNDEPKDDSLVAGPDSSLIQTLQDMGFNEAQARRGLKETQNNVDRAIDWLFSHPDVNVDDSMDSEAKQLEEALAASLGHVEAGATDDARPPHYRLVAAVNHRGSNFTCGHYVAHLWVLFNDRRVLDTPKPALGSAYIYFFRKEDNSM